MSNLRFNSWFVKMDNNLVVFELPKAARALEWTIPWFLLILSTWHACVIILSTSTAIFANF